MDADPLLGEELTTTAVLHAPLAVVQVNLATTRVAAVSEMAAALVAATPAELVGLPARELVANAHDAD